jgi:hypothetical protein
VLDLLIIFRWRIPLHNRKVLGVLLRTKVRYWPLSRLTWMTGLFLRSAPWADSSRRTIAGYFIRTSNDEKDSYDLTLGEAVLGNERDAKAFLQTSGLKQIFDLGYRNHRMDDLARTEMRVRLIFLFRLLQVDTIFSYDPWGHTRRIRIIV